MDMAVHPGPALQKAFRLRGRPRRLRLRQQQAMLRTDHGAMARRQG